MFKEGIQIQLDALEKAVKDSFRRPKTSFCFWCSNENKTTESVIVGRYPVDADMDEEGNGRAIMAEIGMCDSHLADYENQTGVYKRRD